MSEQPSSPAPDDAPRTTRRKSGRVTRKPETIYTSSATATGGAKRKRGAEPDDNADEGASDDDDESDDESTEGEPDEEELRERRRRRRQQQRKTPQKKPAAKKSKTNGEALSLAIRPAAKSKKARKPRPSKIAAAEDQGGLYAEVFAGEEDLAEVAARWLARFKGSDGTESAESKNLMDLVNFVLKCAGCEFEVDVHDIEDPDSCPNKLTDLQEEYQAQNITEYPLISKGKGTANFRHNLVTFFDCLIRTIAETEDLFESAPLVENIETWVSTMSSAANRPFRHTATVISLAITSALCSVGKNLADTNARFLRQSETEAKKKQANKSRVAELEKKVKKAGQRQEKLDNMIKDWFDMVFVHRYRDVDPRIRADCVQSLVDWIITYPDVFLDGNHLRYLGWVLSDPAAPTRLEVVKQLQKLYKDHDKLGGLKTFTERFRSRIVEMATQDAEASVRAASVELLDICRDAGLLEPDDIDSVGRLIFDAEPRVRKAVVPFFAETVNEVYMGRIEELGGLESLEESLASHEGDDYEGPRIQWLKHKCLVEILQSYDDQDEDLPNQIERGPGVNNYVLVAAGLESRFSVAAQALYDAIPEIKEWEVLAGYLLFDHSQSSSGANRNGTSDDPETALKQDCKLNEKEEVVLLDILNAAVKLRLTHTVETGKTAKHKKTKAQVEEQEEIQETAARHLAALIPRLLNKFGAVPDAASAVLRLEHVLNLDVFEELRQDSTTYSALLDDINKQFLTHGSEAVLVEASRALLHAKSYEELGEITEGKMQALWDDTVNALHALKKGKGLTARGNLSENVLTAMSNTVLRISKLASISDCTEALEKAPPAPTGRQRGRASASHQPNVLAVDILTELVARGVPHADTEPELEALEDAVVGNAARALLFYFMWKVRAWESAIASHAGIADDDVEAVALRRDAFVAGLEAVLRARHGAEELRVAVAGALLDLSVLFTTLRQAKPRSNNNNNNAAAAGAADMSEDYMALVMEVEPATQGMLLQVLGAAETLYAKKSRRRLRDAAAVGVTDEPIDVDEDPVSSSSDDEEGGADDVDEADVLRQQEALLAEQRLCELAGKLVLAVVAGVVDADVDVSGEGEGAGDEEGEAAERVGKVRRRLERNKSRLGPNYREVVGYLTSGASEGKKGRRGKSRGPAAANTTTGGGAAGAGARGKHAKSEALVLEEDDIEDDEQEVEAHEEGEHEHEGDDDEGARRRELVVEEDEVVDADVDADAEMRDQEADEESVLGD
ncbi:uncharacterized protein K452DRAFT_352830 [Aplosporella prunicola CBS 121167]|uniref:SCD domain-containing protein n=1 Tax=Aplosporella prunicola CBS 121167 TaxID=1176127 RepID=A0A6A6B355_9PEZI|nr:uncharacterized protein K452DRAFT_352830 [Aplosporella prunicola CBS 121167]KAF2138652.1 hypothetical protein K452DRAFT_352830 [Aplosporella prunicola CBS 121167]